MIRVGNCESTMNPTDEAPAGWGFHAMHSCRRKIPSFDAGLCQAKSTVSIRDLALALCFDLHHRQWRFVSSRYFLRRAAFRTIDSAKQRRTAASLAAWTEPWSHVELATQMGFSSRSTCRVDCALPSRVRDGIFPLKTQFRRWIEIARDRDTRDESFFTLNLRRDRERG